MRSASQGRASSTNYRTPASSIAASATPANALRRCCCLRCRPATRDTRPRAMQCMALTLFPVVLSTHCSTAGPEPVPRPRHYSQPAAQRQPTSVGFSNARRAIQSTAAAPVSVSSSEPVIYGTAHPSRPALPVSRAFQPHLAHSSTTRTLDCHRSDVIQPPETRAIPPPHSRPKLVLFQRSCRLADITYARLSLSPGTSRTTAGKTLLFHSAPV